MTLGIRDFPYLTLGIREVPYLMLGIRDLKQMRAKCGTEVCTGCGTLETTFGIKGLNKILGQDRGILKSVVALIDIRYRSKVSYHPLARRESRRALRETCSAGRDSRSARWPKNFKYIFIMAKILERFQESMVKLYRD